jgi:hypothetical protein
MTTWPVAAARLNTSCRATNTSFASPVTDVRLQALGLQRFSHGVDGRPKMFLAERIDADLCTDHHFSTAYLRFTSDPCFKNATISIISWIVMK